MNVNVSKSTDLLSPSLKSSVIVAVVEPFVNPSISSIEPVLASSLNVALNAKSSVFGAPVTCFWTPIPLSVSFSSFTGVVEYLLVKAAALVKSLSALVVASLLS